MLGLLTLLLPALPPAAPPDSARGLLVGIEYVLIDHPARTRQYARELAPVGFTAMKHYPEHAEWGAMQAGPRAPIDFRRLDAFVGEFQATGARELVICLRSASSWGSKHAPKLRPTNLTPRPEYLELYARWIGAVVERYDADGNQDMPGLRAPVRYYEIGSELSSYEPEPIPEYLVMLEQAYRAAHAAYPAVQVAHAALLTTGADFRNHPGPAGYDSAFAALSPRVAEHSLADIRRLLDRPDLFDVLNIHSLGDPAEIEDLRAWLDWETGRRGYRKPVWISDTAMTPWIAWGNATVCERPAPAMGLVFWPAVPADRCRLAGYFRKLVDGDPATVRWTQGVASADNVKRVVIAAERGIALINTAFVEDLVWLKLKAFGAGTGPSAWSGFLDLGRRERRPAWYGMQQLLGHLNGYDRITRLPAADRQVRLYQVERGARRTWIAWLDPERVVLPGEPVPTREAIVAVGPGGTTVEPLVTDPGAWTPARRPLTNNGGRVTITVTPTPVFILAAP